MLSFVSALNKLKKCAQVDDNIDDDRKTIFCAALERKKTGKSKEGTEMINTKQEMTDMKMKKLIEKMPTHIKVHI